MSHYSFDLSARTLTQVVGASPADVGVLYSSFVFTVQQLGAAQTLQLETFYVGSAALRAGDVKRSVTSTAQLISPPTNDADMPSPSARPGRPLRAMG